MVMASPQKFFKRSAFKSQKFISACHYYTMQRNTKKASRNNCVGLTSSNVMEKYGKFGFRSQSKILARPSSVILTITTSNWDHGIHLTVNHSSEGGRISLNGHDWTNQSVDKICERLLKYLPRTVQEEDWHFDPEFHQDLNPFSWMISRANSDYKLDGCVESDDELKKVVQAFLDDATSQIQPFVFERLSTLSKEARKILTTFGENHVLRLEIPVDEISIVPIDNSDGHSSNMLVQTTIVQKCFGVVVPRISKPDEVLWLSSSLQNIAWLFSMDIDDLRAIAD